MSADVLALAKETSPGATKVSRTTTFSDSRLRDLITLREMQKTTAKIAFENWKWRPHEIASLENWESRPHEIASLAAAGVRQYRYVSLECPGDPRYEKSADAARGNATTA